MADNFLFCLFNNALQAEMKKFNVPEGVVRTAIRDMAEVYQPNASKWESNSVSVADYNSPAHRCAYLHKYGAFHAALVRDMMARAVDEVDELKNIMLTANPFRVCSLGGGPGSDVFGILASSEGLFSMSATIIDIMLQWRSTVLTITKELNNICYGSFGIKAKDQYFDCNYIQHNLFHPMSNEVNAAIGGAHLITMVKFISSAACSASGDLIQKVFRVMKPGSFLLFIDNAAGGFHQLLLTAANMYGFRSVFGPLKHYDYTNEIHKVQRFNIVSCFTTTVTVHLLQKPLFKQDLVNDVSLAKESLLNNFDSFNTNDTSVEVVNNIRQNRQGDFRENRRPRSASRNRNNVNRQNMNTEPETNYVYGKIDNRIVDRRHESTFTNEDECANCCIIS